MKLSNLKIFTVISIILLVSSCAVTKPNIYIPEQQPKASLLKSQPQVALALGGGGARGYAHIGVITALEENNIPIDLVTGCSVGSLIGALYADRGDIQETREIMLHAHFWDFADVSNLPSSGIMSGYHLENFLIKNLHSKNFKNLKKKLAITTTDLKTGKPYIIEGGPIPPAVLASSAIPGVVRPIRIYGKTLVDGGVAEPVPVKLAKKYNPKVIIAINIDDTLPQSIPDSSSGVFEKAFGIIYQRSTAYSIEGADIIIHPQIGQIGIFEISAKNKLYRLGYEATMKAMPQIKQKLAGKNVNLLKKTG